MKNLANTLLTLRLYHRKKQKDVARQLGLTPSYLSELEHGKKIPTMATLQKYAAAFDLPISNIIFVSENYGRPAAAIDLEPHPLLRKLTNWINQT